MGARTAQPGQTGRGKAARAQRDARIYQLAVAGRTERQIAAAENLSPARIHAIIAEEIGRRVGPPAEEYVQRRDAELSELWARAFTTMVTAEDVDIRLKALESARRVNESRRKLRGADAPEALTVSLERRLADETEAVTAAVLAALHVLGVFGERRQAALEAAAAVLRGDPEPAPLPSEAAPAAPCTPYTEGGVMFIDGPGGLRYRVAGVERTPSPVVSRLELEAGPSATRAQQPDGADAVLTALADFEAEFGPLDDGTDGTDTGDLGSDGTDGTGMEGA